MFTVRKCNNTVRSQLLFTDVAETFVWPQECYLVPGLYYQSDFSWYIWSTHSNGILPRYVLKRHPLTMALYQFCVTTVHMYKSCRHYMYMIVSYQSRACFGLKMKATTNSRKTWSSLVLLSLVFCRGPRCSANEWAHQFRFQWIFSAKDIHWHLWSCSQATSSRPSCYSQGS